MADLNKQYFTDDSGYKDYQLVFDPKLQLGGDELAHFIAQLPNVGHYGFSKGVASIDMVPKHLKIIGKEKGNPRYQALVVNTAPSDSLRGDHWFTLGSDYGQVPPKHFYFDSYGYPLHKIYQDANVEMPSMMEKFDPINKSSYQSYGTNTCGHYQLSLLHLLNEAHDKDYEPDDVGAELDFEYLNKRAPLLSQNPVNIRVAIANDVAALKNGETLGRKYVPNADWYETLNNELYDN